MGVTVGAAAMAASILPAPATGSGPFGEVFSCRFPTHGTIVIDMRDDTRSITYRGTRYPVQTGSYFLQGTEDAPLVNGDPIVIAFGPNLDFWEFEGERSADCDRKVLKAQAAASPAPSDDRKLEGMDYNEARRIVLDYGWAPEPGRCEGPGVTAAVCETFPETDSCSGTGLGRCVMRFARPGRCLTIGTIGGPPAPEIDGEPSVEGVGFTTGACP